MFDIARDAEKAIIHVTIYLGDLLGLEKKEDCFITLKEPETFDCVKIAEVRNNPNQVDGAVKYFDSIFDKVLVDHDFVDGTRKLDAAEVHEFLFRKFEVVNYIIAEYMNKVFHSPRTETEEK